MTNTCESYWINKSWLISLGVVLILGVIVLVVFLMSDSGADLEREIAKASAEFKAAKPGYLIFIDEAPKYDWGHSAQMVFFEQTSLNEPKVLFRNTRPRKIVDKDKKEILQQKWILW